MNKTELVNKFTRTFHRTAFKIKKHSPEILIVSGVVGVVSASVMACKATTKLDTILDKAKDDIDKIHEAAAHPEVLPEPYTEEDSKKDLAIVYAKTGLEIAKLYAPSVIIGGLSIAAILTGHNITRQRYMATVAAYTAIDKSFKDYRGRVVERFGEALDKELRYGIQAKEVDTITTNEDGSETVTKEIVNVPTAVDRYSEYARVWDCGCEGWTKNPEYNLMFLRGQEKYANDLLQSKGHLYLNEVYDMLGIPRSRAGQIVGWIYDEKKPIGDNYVDFGIYDVTKPKNGDFINGYENVIILEFNVDGPIIDLM